ncbi:MAG: hypothetical protein JST79_17525 [Acidobacteria bacterium]|jgi:hypothetical protein|nr:hypothetical protein [Acidobacteriota bacterium]
MMRIAIAIFFWVCAVLLFALTMHVEVQDERATCARARKAHHPSAPGHKS